MDYWYIGTIDNSYFSFLEIIIEVQIMSTSTQITDTTKTPN